MNAYCLERETTTEGLAAWAPYMNLRLETQLQERKRIAQELHDTLLQGFTAIGLKLDAIASALPPSLSSLKAQLFSLLEESDQYLAEARRSIWELRSPTLEKFGALSKTLAKVSERALQSTGIRLNFSTEGTERGHEAPIEANLLRICEEAVANAAKHAHPTQVEVSLTFETDHTQMRIRDDGRGFNPAHAPSSKDGHFGLLGIQERAKSMGASLCMRSQPGRGTEIAVTVPQDGLFG